MIERTLETIRRLVVGRSAHVAAFQDPFTLTVRLQQVGDLLFGFGQQSDGEITASACCAWTFLIGCFDFFFFLLFEMLLS